MTPSQITPPPPWGPRGERGSCRPGAEDGDSVAPSRPSRKPLTRRLSKGIVSCSYIVGWRRTLGHLGTRRNPPSLWLLGAVAPRGCQLHTTDTHAGALGWGSIPVVFFPDLASPKLTLRVLSLSHQAAAAYKGKGRSQPTCRARGCRDRLGIPKPPPPGGGHAPRGAPSTRAARSLGRTHRPRLPGVRCPRATSCQRPPCVSRAAYHRAKRRAGVRCSLPMLGPCTQRHSATRQRVVPTDRHSFVACQ